MATSYYPGLVKLPFSDSILVSLAQDYFQSDHQKGTLFGKPGTFAQAFFSRESILWWVITTFRLRRRQYQAVFQRGDFTHLGVIELKRPADADRLLKSL